MESFRLPIFIACFVLPLLLEGQVTVTPSGANACTCTGIMSFVSPISQPVTYTLYDQSGVQVSSGASANGNFAINALCPSVFTLLATQNGTTQSYYFNIPTIAIDPGDAQSQSVCSTDGAINLNGLIPGIVGGGNWMDVAGNPLLSQPVITSTMTEGWYTYEIASGACAVTTGVYVDYIQNANTGLQTTYDICETGAVFLMTTILEGTPDPNGKWYNSAAVEVDGYFDPTTMNDATFTYLIDTVQGCSPVFTTLVIDVLQQPYAGDDTQILVCQNGVPFDMTYQLEGSPDLGGQWTTLNGTPISPIFNPAIQSAGFYNYTISATAPSYNDDSYLTIVFTTDNPSGLSASVSACETGANINMFSSLNGNPLPGGTWTNAAGQVVDGIFDPGNEPAGAFTYYYPNVGCSPANSVVTINIESLPNAGPDNTLSVCQNTPSINLNTLLGAGVQLGGVWSYSNGTLISNIFTPPASGNSFQFDYTQNGFLCPNDQATFTLNLQPLPADPPDQQFSFCPGDPPLLLSSLYPGFPSIQFQNQNGTPANASFDPTSASSATLLAVQPSSNSCPSSTGTISLIVNSPIFADDSIETDVCNVSGLYNLNSILNANIATAGVWYDQNENPAMNPVVLDFTGTRDFHFVLNGSGFCAGSELFLTLNVNNPVDAGNNTSLVFCNSDSPHMLTDLLPSAAQGTGVWTYNGQPFLSNQIDPSVDQTGSYLYSIPATGACPGDVAELYITIQQGLDYSAGPDISGCSGDASVQIGDTPIANCTYNWTPSNNLSNTNVSAPFVSFYQDAVDSITDQFTVVVDDGVCTITDQVNVTTHPIPEVDLGPDVSVCFGETIQLHETASGNYSWTPASLFQDATSPDQSLLIQQDTQVQLLIISEFGCQASDNLNILVQPLPYIVLVPEHFASCSPLHIEYFLENSSTNVDHLNWNIPDIGSYSGDTLRMDIPQTGIYDLSVTAISDFGCSSDLQFAGVMEVYPSPFASFSTYPDQLTTIDPIAHFTNQSYGEISSEWDFGGLAISYEESPSFEFPNANPDNFEICLKVINENGCADSTCNILHLDNEYIIYVPNAITPDNDGINDVFLPILKGFDETTYTLEIFDRWGRLLFVTHEIGKVWTGNVSDGEYYVKDDVYNWQITVKDKEVADYRTFRGFVTVLR